MSPKHQILPQKLRYSMMYGGLFLGVYLVFANRHKLMGDLEAQRDVLFADDKEARILLERAKIANQRS